MHKQMNMHEQMKQWCFKTFVKPAEEDQPEEPEEALQEPYEWHKYRELRPGDKVSCKHLTVKNARRVLTVATVGADTVTFELSGHPAHLRKFGITYHLCDRLLNKTTQKTEWVVHTCVHNGIKRYVLHNGKTVREDNKQYTKVAPTAAQIAAYKAKEQARQRDREYYLYVPTQEQQQAYVAMMREKDPDFQDFQYDSDDDDDDDSNDMTMSEAAVP